MWLQTHYMPNTVATPLLVYSIVHQLKYSLFYKHCDHNQYESISVTSAPTTKIYWCVLSELLTVKAKLLCSLLIKKSQAEISVLILIQIIRPHLHILPFRIHFDTMYSGINLPVSPENNYLQLQSSIRSNETCSRESRNFFTSRITTNFSSMTLLVSLQNEAGNFNSYSEGTNLSLIHKGRNTWQQPWPYEEWAAHWLYTLDTCLLLQPDLGPQPWSVLNGCQRWYTDDLRFHANYIWLHEIPNHL